MSSIVVSELNIFPLKSAKSIRLDSMNIQNRGPVHDRHWMFVDGNGRYISQRECAQLCLIKTSLDIQGRLILSAQGMPPLTINPPSKKSTSLVEIWDDRVYAEDCGDEVVEWAKQLLGIDCRMVYMPAETRREIDPTYAKNNEIVSFSDEFPILLISQESLDELNSHLEYPVAMERFRPNIVVKGGGAYAEDQWRLIRIGDIEMRVVKPCKRCVIPSIDQHTAQKQHEVIRVLAKHRRRDGKVHFGQNLIHTSHGRIAVDDEVQVIQ